MDFFREAKKFRLPLTVDDVPQLKTVPEMASFAMSAKKSHEVKRFSQLVCDDVLKQCEHVQQVSVQQVSLHSLQLLSSHHF